MGAEMTSPTTAMSSRATSRMPMGRHCCLTKWIYSLNPPWRVVFTLPSGPAVLETEGPLGFQPEITRAQRIYTMHSRNTKE